ncbi:MAG: gliding motility-associated C-terminal domain-containing protein [Bacteroidia bacterium]
MKLVASFVLAIWLCLFNGNWAVADDAPLVFIPNAGQWEGPQLFQANVGNAAVFFLPSELRIAMYDAHAVHQLSHRSTTAETAVLLKQHALRIDFPGAHTVKPTAHGEVPKTKYNYFLGDRKASVKGSQQLLYTNLYDGIDMLWYSADHQLKYDFVVAAGAAPAQIKVRYTGGDKLELVDGRLRVSTSLGYYYEEVPYAWQLIAGRKEEVPCRFVLQQGVISFEFPKSYDKSRPLTIDPTLVFSTYSGGQSDNFGFTACTDVGANMFLGGIVFGPDFPITTGAYIDTFAGNRFDGATLNFDIAIMKFDPLGTNLLYATFLGGDRIERPHSLITDADGNLLIMGATNSLNFPMPSSAHQSSIAGNYDIFISKLSSDGSSLLAGSFFGGPQADGLNIGGPTRWDSPDEYRGDIVIASNGDLLLASTTQSSGLGTAGTFQPNYGGGLTDGLVARFNSSLSQLRWASYVGGSSIDALFSIKEGGSGEVVVAGGTNSTNLTLPGLGYQMTHAGGVDGMILRLDANSGQGITGTFLGSPGYDQIFFIDIHSNGDVYFAGQTDSNLVTLNTNYNDPNSGQYIGCMSPQLGVLRWLGRFGSRSRQPDMSLSAFVVDLCRNIYVSGWTGRQVDGRRGPTNLQLTNNAFQTTTDSFDFYFAAFSPNMLTLQYATYFGGSQSPEHVDGGTSRFDKRGVMYQAICAGCHGNSDLPVTPGAWATSNGSTRCNMAAVKLAFQLESGLGALFGWQDPPTYCAPLSLQMEDFSRVVANTSWEWTVNDGQSSTAQNPVFTFPEPGTYRINLRISSPDACNGFDTLSRTVTVFGPPEVQLPPDTCVCSEDNWLLRSNIEGQSYNWLGPVQGNERELLPTESGQYKLELTDLNGCEGEDSIRLIVVSCFGETTNVITPNGDGKNDRLVLPSEDFDSFELKVFNRWGQHIFTTNNPVTGWGGENSSGTALVESGDYVVRLKARFCGDRTIERDFPVRLIR